MIREFVVRYRLDQYGDFCTDQHRIEVEAVTLGEAWTTAMAEALRFQDGHPVTIVSVELVI